jgi:HlyD family secretion protein
MPFLVPIPLAADTVEALLAERARRPPLIYLFIIALAVGAVVALPIVRVPVTARSPGIIRSADPHHEVRAPISGRLDLVEARENDRVSRGDLLLRIHSTGLEARDSIHAQQREELEVAIDGLRRLDTLAAAPARSPTVVLPRYQQELAQHRYAVLQQRSRIAGLARDLEAARELYERQAGPRVEVDRLVRELDGARIEAAAQVARNRGRWRQEREERERRLQEVIAQQSQLRAERDLGEVTAPISGSIEELAGVSPGSFVQAGDPLLVISPAATLSAEALVGSREIGLLHSGMLARLAVDAFPYVDWGLITGRVEQIPADATVVDGTPLYRVRISLDRDHLVLENGARGTLRKGMTVQANFTLSERTLLQLIRDDISAWLNPSRSDVGRPAARE